MKMKENQDIIFDMDGVLVHSNPVHKEAIDIFCQKHECNVTEEFLRENVYGVTNKEWIPKVFDHLTEEEVKELGDEKEELFRELFDPVANQVKGAVDFIKHAASHSVKMAVATSAPGENARYILNKLGIIDYFEVVLDSSHVNKGKPDPEIYIKAIDALNLKPEYCVIFEDSVAGVQAAKSAGCKTIGVTTTHSVEEMSDCDKIISNFEELKVDEALSLLK